MKHLLQTIVCLFLLSCGGITDTPVHEAVGVSKLQGQQAPILGERINGPAHIRDTVNGEILFTLNDSTLVTCTEAVDGWFQVGLMMDIPYEEFNVDTIRKGRKIYLEGKEVGIIMKDIRVSTLQSGKQSYAELIGYTFKDNIHPQSIIENALADFLQPGRDRSETALQSFIRDFKMEKDTSSLPFITYMNYENWVDDPSPMMRIQLVFEANQLIGVVHSRNLQLQDFTNYELERGFSVAFFNSTSPASKDRFIRSFNAYIRMVD